jgi:tetratricopeptide (TPR) repeat protein
VIRAHLAGKIPFVPPIAAACGIAILALALAFAAPAARAQANGISIQISEQVFATMCALDAAGFDADVSTLSEMPARRALRDELLQLHGPATEEVRSFYKEHAFADPAETLSRYITFALAIGAPPQFDFQFRREDLPPDVLALDGFQPILARFYREARLEQQWVKIEPEYVRAVGRDDATLRRIVFVTNGYLRELMKPSARTFTVYVEPLAGNRANFRNFGDHYSMVIGAGTQFPTEQVQHAYLHFMLDPLPLRYRKDLDKKTELINAAGKAPRLPEVYRSDFIAFVDECFIKAVELRLKKLPAAQLEQAMRDNDESGFILVRTFVAELQKFEKAEPAMDYYFPDIIADIDVAAEEKRAKTIAFAAAEETPAAESGGAAAHGTPASELEVWLAQGDRDIAAQDGFGASEIFTKVLVKYPNEPRAIYGIAVASVLRKDVDEARENFARIVTMAGAGPGGETPSAAGTGATVDPRLLAWSHVYLGRIHDIEGDRELAVNEYRAALAVEGAPEAARVAAQRGADAPYAPGHGSQQGTHQP